MRTERRLFPRLVYLCPFVARSETKFLWKFLVLDIDKTITGGYPYLRSLFRTAVPLKRKARKKEEGVLGD